MKKSIIFILLFQFSSLEAYKLSESKISSSSYENPMPPHCIGIEKSVQAKKYSGKKSYCNVKGLLCVGIGLPFLIFNLMKNEKTPIIPNPTKVVPGIGGILNGFMYKNDSIPQNFANTNWTDFLPVSKIPDSPLINSEVNQNVIGKIPSEKSIMLFKEKSINSNQKTESVDQNIIQKYIDNESLTNGMCDHLMSEGNKSLAIPYSPVLTCEAYKEKTPKISDQNTVSVKKKDNGTTIKPVDSNERFKQIRYEVKKLITLIFNEARYELGRLITVVVDGLEPIQCNPKYQNFYRIENWKFPSIERAIIPSLITSAKENNISLRSEIIDLFSNKPIDQNLAESLIKKVKKYKASENQSDLDDLLSMVKKCEDNQTKPMGSFINKNFEEEKKLDSRPETPKSNEEYKCNLAEAIDAARKIREYQNGCGKNSVLSYTRVSKEKIAEAAKNYGQKMLEELRLIHVANENSGAALNPCEQVLSRLAFLEDNIEEFNSFCKAHNIMPNDILIRNLLNKKVSQNDQENIIRIISKAEEDNGETFLLLVKGEYELLRQKQKEQDKKLYEGSYFRQNAKSSL